MAILLSTRVREQREREQKGFAQDISNLQRFLQNRQLRITDPNQAPIPFPKASSIAGNRLFGQFLLNQQAGGRQQQGFTLGQGQQRFDASGRPIAQVAAGPKTRTVESNIVDPDDPKEIIRISDTIDSQTGKLLNRRVIGEPTLAAKFGGVAPEVFTNLQKPVAAKIQTELKDVEVNIANLESILDQFRPEFTETPFKIGQKITALREKAGKFDPLKPFLGPVTEEQKAVLGAFSAWRRDASREFVVFKKWATGVAAGQKEMSEQIEQAFASPLKDSATQFKSKIESAIRVRRRTRDILRTILNSGTIVSIGGKKEAEQNALRIALREETARRQRQENAGALSQQLRPGEILVIDKATRETGALPENEFDPNLFERVR